MPASRSPYDVLNVAPDAEGVVIEAAYRALMKKYHPDQAAAAEAGGPSAAEINEAFALLRDPARRGDYHQREWRRQKNMLMAPYQPPPPPRSSRAFGWGGWCVALVLGVVIAVMAGRTGGAKPDNAAEAARAAALAEPDFRSQPSLADAAAVAPAVAAEIQAEALAVPPPASGPARAAARPPRSRFVLIDPPRRAPRAKPSRRAAPPAAAKAEDKEFLEREGYIY
jgi:curved DNA-binding protein CbpA